MKLCASESFSCSWLSLKPTFVGSLFPQQWLSVVVVVARASLWTRWRLRWLRWKSGDEGKRGRGEEEKRGRERREEGKRGREGEGEEGRGGEERQGEWERGEGNGENQWSSG